MSTLLPFSLDLLMLLLAYILLLISTTYYVIRFHQIKRKFERLNEQYLSMQYDLIDKKIDRLEFIYQNHKNMLVIPGLQIAIDVLKEGRE